MMKKALLIFLAMVMCLSTFASCGEPEATTGTTQTTDTTATTQTTETTETTGTTEPDVEPEPEEPGVPPLVEQNLEIIEVVTDEIGN